MLFLLLLFPNVDETAPLAKLLIYAWLGLSENIHTYEYRHDHSTANINYICIA